MANFEKFGHFGSALAMKKHIWPFYKIWPFFGHFCVCHCTMKFSLNIFRLFVLFSNE